MIVQLAFFACNATLLAGFLVADTLGQPDVVVLGGLFVLCTNGQMYHAFLLALWRALNKNRRAEIESERLFQVGNVWYRNHGRVFDPDTGLVRPSDGPIVHGRRSVALPLLLGTALAFLFWQTNVLLLP